MLPEDILDLLEKVAAQRAGEVMISTNFDGSWSCAISVAPCGYGTGDSALSAIEDALDDMDRSGRA